MYLHKTRFQQISWIGKCTVNPIFGDTNGRLGSYCRNCQYSNVTRTTKSAILCLVKPLLIFHHPLSISIHQKAQQYELDHFLKSSILYLSFSTQLNVQKNFLIPGLEPGSLGVESDCTPISIFYLNIKFYIWLNKKLPPANAVGKMQLSDWHFTHSTVTEKEH